MPARLINWRRRWGQRWTLRTLKRQLSCQLLLTHCCQLWANWSRPVREKSPSLHLKLAVCSVCPSLFSASTHIWSKLPYVVQSVLSPEKELIPQPDPPFSPAFLCVPCRRSQSASICISSTVILQPWMLKLHFTPFHILSLFLGFMQFSLILACAGLSVLQHRQLPRWELFWFSSTSAPLQSHCCSWDWPAHTRPRFPPGVLVVVSYAWPWRRHCSKKQRWDLQWSLLIP